MPWTRTPYDASCLPLVRKVWEVIEDEAELMPELKVLAAHVRARDGQDAQLFLEELGKPKAEVRTLVELAEDLGGDPWAVLAAAALAYGRPARALLVLAGLARMEEEELQVPASRLLKGQLDEPIWALAVLLDAGVLGPPEPAKASPGGPRLGELMGLEDPEEWSDVEPFGAILHDGAIWFEEPA